MKPPYQVLDLFSGIGGFSLGLERTGGFETVAFCEIEEFPRKVLAKHWPKVTCYDDVRTLTASRLAADGIAVNAICGGFPCQDISIAGHGAGLSGARSGLYYEVERLICELEPTLVILENVAELLGRGMGDVLGSLAGCGYDAEWRRIRGSQVGVSQDRDRVWILAYPMQDGRPRFLQSINFGAHGQGWAGSQADLQSVIDLALVGSDRFPKPLLRRVDDRPSNWVDRVGACGNAVIPHIPELIGHAIMAANLHRGAA